MMSLHKTVLGGFLFICLHATNSMASNTLHSCKSLEFEAEDFTVCNFSAKEADVRLFWGEGAKPYGHFEPLAQTLAAENERLIFAMNGGMYHKDRAPVGLYVDEEGQRTGLQVKASYGNFGMLPNGVFHKTANGVAVTETKMFQAKGISPDFATQSGPMLVIENKLHPKFNKGSSSKRIRNGVGVSADGQRVYFVMSDQPVNFHTFARVFRDELLVPNALYLDGVISRLYEAASGRNDYGVAMGPILAVVGPNDSTLNKGRAE